MRLNCNDLRAALTAENAALRAFVEVLRQEQQVLLEGKTDQLNLFAQQKAQWILELTKLCEQRQQLLRNCGMTPDRAGMEQLLQEHYAGESQEAAQWAHLLHMATRASQINACNGLLISERMKNTHRALSTLFSTARVPAAYGSDGSTIGFRATHQIAVA